VYFNGLFALAAGAAFSFTGQEAFLLIAFVQHMVVLQQLLPLLRFDGYYVLSDLTGVPDILSRIKPIFRSLVRGKRSEPRVDELKSWVRVVVTVYLVVLIPTLLFMFTSTVLHAPRVFATVADSLGLQLDRIQQASGFTELALAFFRIGALILPAAAISISLARSGRMAGLGLWRWSSGSVPRRAAVTVLFAAAAGAVAYTWWPNGDYQPIRPGERGTVGEAVRAIPDFTTGRPSFTEASERRHVGEPTEREAERDARPVADPRSAPTATQGAEPGARTTPTPADAENPDAGRTPEPDDTATPDATAPPEGNATATPEATHTAPTATATATPVATETATPDSTATAEPTSTPTTTATATATPEATSSPEPTTPAVAAESPTAETTPAEATPAEASTTPTP
jgi:putative peptide zinc metalloprotease protein